MKVALTEAPFGPAIWPSIGVSLLKARLRREEIQASVVYANHFFLDMMGPAAEETLNIYQNVSDAFAVHLGEWIFVNEAFPDAVSRERDGEFLAALAREGVADDLIATAERLRALVEPFLERALARVDWEAYQIVGFANSFSQLNASIALARRMRARWPHLRFIIGGAGCSDEMGEGVAEACELFSAVALGEADEIIAPLCKAVAAEDDAALAAIPGIVFRDKEGALRRGPPKRRVMRMDDSPTPDYDDYYVALPSAYRPKLPFYLPIEASRGCWWGAKHHCVFCGLNPDRMAYHAKSPERFLSETAFLSQRYDPPRFMAVDNIMPHEFYDEVLPGLREASGGAEFFFEVKANFKKEQLAAFAQAGVRQIQPGLESLSTPVLRLMKKGVTGPANIATLRFCQEFGIRAHWSILHGFHGESEEDYLAQLELARRLTHLRPPLGVFKAEVERFAPMYRFPDEHGLVDLRPSHWYRYCYPTPDAVLAKLAYRFDADAPDLDLRARNIIHGPLRAMVASWKELYFKGESTLSLAFEGACGRIERRLRGVEVRYRLTARALELYQAFDRPRRPQTIVSAPLFSDMPTPYLDPRFRAACAQISDSTDPIDIDAYHPAEIYHQLLIHGLLVQEGGLAVAIACSPPQSAPQTFHPQEVAP